MTRFDNHAGGQTLAFERSLQVLLENGAQSGVKDSDGRIPFVMACEQLSLGTTYMLLQHGLYGAGTPTLSFKTELATSLKRKRS